MKLFLILILALNVFGFGQLPPVEATKTDTPPVIDGKLDEPLWDHALRMTGFKAFKPDYGLEPSEQTIAFMAYDREYLYFGIRCFDREPGKIKSSVTRRDNMFEDDFVGVVIDTFRSNQEGYGFLVNAFGIQGDGIMNVQNNLNSDHDMVWYSKGVVDDKGYTVEMKIPFKSIRFPSKKEFTVSVGIFRQLARQTEDVVYPPMKVDGGNMLSQMQPVKLSDVKYHRVVEVLPAFTYTRVSEEVAGTMTSTVKESEASLTAKLGLTSQLTLDATVNPDFSQVESDAGQIDVNLRYSLYYSEKRPFFLEGNEIFDFAGNTEEAPLWAIVHTRNIVDPSYGFKLTGKLGRRDTIAGIYAHDNGFGGVDNEAGVSIFRFKHGLSRDSYIGGFYTNRLTEGTDNHVYGADGRFRLFDTGVAEFHYLGSNTLQDGAPNETGHAVAGRLELNDRKYALDLGVQDVSENFRVDSGFLTRPGVTRIAAFGMYRFFPKSDILLKVEPFYWSYHLKDKESGLWETFNLFTLRLYLPLRTQFRFDFVAGNEVYAGQRFNIGGMGFQANSQLSKHFSFSLFYRGTNSILYDMENPYGGRSNRVSATIDYQPTDQLNTSLTFSYQDFYIPETVKKIYEYMIVRSRTTFQVNKYLFFRGIVEYNDFYDRLNLDLLASFTYIPGTVIHLGYGSQFEKLQWVEPDYITADRYLEMRRGFFFKVSYLWRL